MSEADTLISFFDYFSLHKLREHWAGESEKPFSGANSSFFRPSNRCSSCAPRKVIINKTSSNQRLGMRSVAPVKILVCCNVVELIIFM